MEKMCWTVACGEAILGLGNSTKALSPFLPQLHPCPILLSQRCLTATELLGVTRWQNFPCVGQDRHPRVRTYSPGMKGFQEGSPPPLHQKALMGPHCREDSLLNHLHLACFFSYWFCSFSCLEEHVFFHAHLLKLTISQLAWTSRLS